MKTLTVYGDNAGARYLVERDGGTAGWDGNDWGETVSEEDPDNLEEIETMNGEVGL